MLLVGFLCAFVTMISAQPYGIAIDVLLDETFEYMAPIGINATDLTEISSYTRFFTAVTNYPSVDIRISIPFTGNQVAGQRARVLVYFDTDAIYDATMYATDTWDLKPLNILASKTPVLTGNHVIKIYAAVDGGTLYIPWFDSALIEATVMPTLFGTMTVEAHK